MREITIDEYYELTPIIKKEMIELGKHERKNSYQVQMSKGNSYVRDLDDSTKVYQIYSLGFSVVEQDYQKAVKETPECFGTGNAKDVVHAMFVQAQKRGWAWDEKRYEEYLSDEVFCLLLFKQGKEISNNILRIDLFRYLKESQTNPGRYDFVGGLFHALKHFSLNGRCASILPNQNVALYDIEQLIWPIANAFYKGPWKRAQRSKTFETSINYLGKRYTLIFFKEDDSNVSFVNTVIPNHLERPCYMNRSKLL